MLAMEEVLAKAKVENRALNDTEKGLYEDLKAEIEELEASKKAELELDEMKNELRRSVTPKAHAEPRNPNDKKWRCLGEYLQKVRAAYAPGGEIDSRLLTNAKAATGMQIGVASDGGFAVDDQFISDLQSSMMDKSEILSRITMIPTGKEYGGIKMPALDETSRANGSRWGGVTSSWANEGGTAAAGKVKMRKLALDLEKLMAFVYVTDELLMDATALENYVMLAFSDELSFRLNDAIVNGDGAGKPLGILNSNALITVSKEAAQAADTVVYENVANMYNRMPPRHRRNACWLINQELEPQLQKMYLALGLSGVPVYMPANGVSGEPYATMYGKPVIPIEQCSKLGDVGDIIYADLSAYIGTDKGGLNMDSSIHLQFLYDEQVFRFRYRFNGAPYYSNVVASYKNSNFTLSPFITLQAR
jgi:HK97 family phage major capsid protein